MAVAASIKKSPWRARIDEWINEGCSAKEIYERLQNHGVCNISQRTISRYMKERKEQIGAIVGQKVAELRDLEVLQQVDEAAYLQLVIQRAHKRLMEDPTLRPSISQAIHAADVLGRIKARGVDDGETRDLFSGKLVQRIIAGAVQGTLAAAGHERLSVPPDTLVVDGQVQEIGAAPALPPSAIVPMEVREDDGETVSTDSEEVPRRSEG